MHRLRRGFEPAGRLLLGADVHLEAVSGRVGEEGGVVAGPVRHLLGPAQVESAALRATSTASRSVTEKAIRFSFAAWPALSMIPK
jgi:hypothetical protein